MRAARLSGLRNQSQSPAESAVGCASSPNPSEQHRRRMRPAKTCRQPPQPTTGVGACLASDGFKTRSPGKQSAPGANLPRPQFPGCALRAYPGYETKVNRRQSRLWDVLPAPIHPSSIGAGCAPQKPAANHRNPLRVWELALQATVSKLVARVSKAHPGPTFHGHNSPDARYALIRAIKNRPQPGFLRYLLTGVGAGLAGDERFARTSELTQFDGPAPEAEKPEIQRMRLPPGHFLSGAIVGQNRVSGRRVGVQGAVGELLYRDADRGLSAQRDALQ